MSVWLEFNVHKKPERMPNGFELTCVGLDQAAE